MSTLTEKVDAQDKKFDDVFKANDRLLGKIKGTGDTPKTDWDQVKLYVDKTSGKDKNEALDKVGCECYNPVKTPRLPS